MKKEKKERKRNKKKPRYNLWQNSAYMISRALKIYPGVLVLALALVAVMVAQNLVGLFIAPTILGKVEQAAPLGELLGTIAVFSALLILLSGIKAYLDNNTVFGRIEIRTQILNDVVYKHLTTSYPNTEDAAVLKKLDEAGEALNTNSAAAEGIWNTLVALLRDVIGFVVYLLLLSNLDFVLMLIVVTTSVIGYFSAKQINGWGWRHREEGAEHNKRMYYINECSRNILLAKDIRIFGMCPWLKEVYDGARRLYRDFVARRESIYLWADFIDVALSFVRSGIAYVYLLAFTLKNSLPASEFLLYFTAVSGFSTLVTGILSGFSTLHQQSLDLNIVREFLELPDPFLFSEGEALTQKSGEAYELCLENVSYRYPKASEDTIHGMNLKIKPEEKLAIVGLNGAGKTTLVKLLCGFYDPTDGRVLLNGRDIREFNRRDYYAFFSAVFQQFSVLEATVAENVAQKYLDEKACEVDMQRVWKCLDQAGLSEKIESLPMRELTHIGRKVFEDGVELSGGQMQRLMLARALYKDAPIVVLDEPTAALDAIAENDIYQKYNEFTAAKTSVFISHRLASTRFCDRILFLEKGVIVEEGTHETLLAAGGKYAQLFAVQSKYYKEGGEAAYE